MNNKEPQPPVLKFVNSNEYIHIVGNKLPHWNQVGCVQFVTFRLADSLPQSKLLEYKEMKIRWECENPKPWDEQTQQRYNDTFTPTVDKWIDAGYGSCMLKDSKVRDSLSNVMMHFDGERYTVHAYVIMPNHVHALLTPMPGNTIQKIVGSWKQYATNEFKKYMDIKGSVWEHECFDHLIRNADYFSKTLLYIMNNPKHLPADAYTLYIQPQLQSMIEAER